MESTLDIRPFLDDEEFAIYAMRLAGGLGPEELPGAEDLAQAILLTRDHLILQNALQALERHYTSGGRTAEAPETVDESAPSCPWCGGDTIAVEWHGPTGVTSPDGGQEYQTQRGYRCRMCGLVEV
jgi:hypothetical protein